MTAYIGTSPANIKTEVVQVSVDKESSKALGLVRVVGHLTIALCALLQCIFFLTVDANAVSVLVVAAVTMLTIQYTLHESRFSAYPISFMLILGFNLVSLGGALIAMTIGFVPLVEYLMVPLRTFSLLAVAQVTLIVAHIIYRHSTIGPKASLLLQKTLLVPLKVFERPSGVQLWFMGFIGCAAVLVSRVGSYGGEKTFSGDDLGAKAFAGFAVLVAAPFLGPVLDRIYPYNKPLKNSPWPLITYFLGLIIIGTLANTRQIFADVLATFGLGYFLLFATGRIEVTSRTVVKIAGMLAAAVLLLPVIARVAIAMVMVREYRADSDALTLLGLTWDAMGNDAVLAAYAMDAKTTLLGEYNEFYINNPLLARLIITKFHDNMFYFTQALLPDDSWLIFQNMADRVIAYLPQPALDLLGISVNKTELLNSTGDYIFFLATGYGLGGYRTGSMIAEGFAMMGFVFPFAFGILAIFCYVIYDAFTLQVGNRLAIFSPIILLQIWYLFGGVGGSAFGAEGISNVIGGFMRGMPQLVIIYWLVFSLVQYLTTTGNAKSWESPFDVKP